MWGAAMMGGRILVLSGTLSPVDTSGGGGHVGTGFIEDIGGGGRGQLSPKLINNIPVMRIEDDASASPVSPDAVLYLGNDLLGRAFAGDPGQAYLISLLVGGVTRTGASAVYSYSQSAFGQARWRWANQGWGIAAGGATNFTLRISA